MKRKKSKITWKIIKLAPSKIMPTPNNFKLKTESGLNMFDTSVEIYGRAGVIHVNAKEPNGKYYIINGNTNLEKAKELKEKFVYAMVPSKKLTPKQYTEFSAMFDRIRAGEVDTLRIDEELGVTKDFFKLWGLPMPDKRSLNKLAELEKAEIRPNKNAKKDLPEQKITTRQVTLIFTSSEADEFIRLAESMYKRFKSDNVTDVSLKVMRYVIKH